MSAIVAAALGLGSDASAEPNEPFLRIAIPAAAFAGLYLILTMRRAVERFPALGKLPGAWSPSTEGKPMADEGKKINVTSYDQTGGITAGEIHISAPQPSVHAQHEVVNEKTEDGYVTRVGIHLDQPYAASNMAVLVKRTDLKSFDVKLKGSGMISIGGVTFDGGEGKVINAPLVSDYQAVIVTEKPDDLDIGVQLNVQIQEPPPS